MKQGYYPDTVMELQQLRQSAQQPQTYVPVQRNPMKVAKRKRSTLLLISLVLGALFSVVLASVTFGQTDKILSQTATTAEDVGFQLGTMIGTALMIPQMIDFDNVAVRTRTNTCRIVRTVRTRRKSKNDNATVDFTA